MAYFEWNDTLSVGNTVIDNDHKVLIGYINTFHDAMSKGTAKEIVGKTLEKLISYTIEHFEREEVEMRRINYSRTLTHQYEHKTLIDEIFRLKKLFDSGNELLTMQISRFLKEWLTSHILETDKKFALALRNAG